jgi:hypothetical protein
MDGKRFDALLKTVTAGASRRRLVQGLIAGALGLGVVTTRNSPTRALQPEVTPPRWRGCRYRCPSGAEVARCVPCPGDCPDIRYRGETCTVCEDTPCIFGNNERGACTAPTSCPPLAS